MFTIDLHRYIIHFQTEIEHRKVSMPFDVLTLAVSTKSAIRQLYDIGTVKYQMQCKG